MRTLVDIEDADVARLDEVAARLKQSRAALIRRAISDFLGKGRRQSADDAFGLWGKGKIDGLAYERKVRAEW
jgi:predicted transcriptional regulator